MKKAILAVACSVGIALMASAAPVFAAQAFRTHFVVEPAEGSALQAGDTLVANGQGQVALYRGHELVAVIQDPNDIAAEAAAARPLYLTLQEAAIIGGDLRDYDGVNNLSDCAPIVPFHRLARSQVLMADAG